MELDQRGVVESELCEVSVFDLPFQRKDVKREVRRKFGVAQDAETGFDKPGGMSRRASSASSIA